MNFENPTQIHLGMSGKFSGRSYRVVGRALLGEMEFGRIYYWTEYYLETPGEELVTLVYEEALLGVEWRWFTLFDPKRPLTADDAATKKVGDIVDLDGVQARVSLVRESQVYHTEGRAPEGVRPGARANYFNAETGSKLLVVSWTGAEVEFYRGVNLTPGTVVSGFNLRTAELARFRVAAGESTAPAIWTAIGVGIFVIALVIIMSSVQSPTHRLPAVTTYSFAAPALKAGSSGSLSGVSYRIEGHAEVQFAEFGWVIVRHEFFLRGSDGNDALLIFGWKPGAKDWLLLTPVHPSVALTPQQAGNIRVGQTVNVDGTAAQVRELFRSTVVLSENPNEPSSNTGDVLYGFSGQAGAEHLLARWNEHEIIFHKGRLIQERDVMRAFSPRAGAGSAR